MIQMINDARSYETQDRSLECHTANLFYCVKHRAETDRSFFINSAGFYCILYFVSGNARLSDEEIKKGDLVFFSKLCHVEVEIARGSEWYCVMYEYSHLIPMLEGKAFRILHGSLRMWELSEALYDSGAYRATMPGVREAMLLVILNEANQAVLAESKSLVLYDAAVAWIEQNASRAIGVQDVAAAMRCTREHLNRVFRAAGGLSVSERIAKTRVWEIEQLCRASSLSLSEIARRLDFPSVELLCKYFRYHKGVSLRQFRSMNL